MDREAELQSFRPSFPPTDDNVIVCHVNNGMFTAAGIAYDEMEYDVFKDPNDQRPKKWYLLSKWKLTAHSLDKNSLNLLIQQGVIANGAA